MGASTGSFCCAEIEKCTKPPAVLWQTSPVFPEAASSSAHMQDGSSGLPVRRRRHSAPSSKCFHECTPPNRICQQRAASKSPWSPSRATDSSGVRGPHSNGNNSLESDFSKAEKSSNAVARANCKRRSASAIEADSFANGCLSDIASDAICGCDQGQDPGAAPGCAVATAWRRPRSDEVHDYASRTAATLERSPWRSDSVASFDAQKGATPDRVCSKPRLKHQTSQDFFSQPDQTVIVFDWDDTLFPSSWLRKTKPEMMKISLDKLALEPRGPIINSLRHVADLIDKVLQKAEQLSKHVAIVTLASERWVEMAIRLFMPSLKHFLEDFRIKVLYAWPLAKSVGLHPRPDEGFVSAEEEARYWSQVKSLAVESVCAKCYSQYPRQTWKNVLSIGDSEFELKGTRYAVKRWCVANANTAYQLPRTKTVKMMKSPTCDQLASQLELLNTWLPALVKREQGFSINLGLPDDDPDDPRPTVGEQLKSSAAEGPGCALHQGFLWKLTSDGDPFREEDWLPRRLWLSPGGRLWHDCLEKGEALQCFHNTLAGALQVKRLWSGSEVAHRLGGETIYAFSIESASSVDKAGSMMIVAATSLSMQEAWIECIEKFKEEEFDEESNIAVGGG